MPRLEKVTYICLIFVTLLSSTLLLEERFWPRAVPGRRGPATTNALVGKHIEFPNVAWDHSARNVILFISSRCHFCDESSPLYRHLANLRETTPPAAIYVITRDDVPTMKQYLATKQIQVDGIYLAKVDYTQSLGLRGTPTLLVVDSTGTVKRSYVGKLDNSREQDLMAALQSHESGLTPIDSRTGGVTAAQ